MKEKAQNKKRHFEIFSVLVIVATLFMSVAFAEISDIELLISGTITPQIQHGVYIKKISAISREGVVSESVNYYSGTTLSTSLELSDSPSSSLIYDITLYNSDSDAYFVGVNYVDEAYSNENITYHIDGLDSYVTVIHPEESINFMLEFKYDDGYTPTSTEELNSLLNFSFSNTFIEFALGVEGDYNVYENVPEGATWEQWIKSEYNEEFTVSKGKVYIGGKQVYIKDKEVKITDVIDDVMYNYKPELKWNKDKIYVTQKIGEVLTIESILRLSNVKVDDNFKYSSSDPNIVEIESVTINNQSPIDVDIHFKIKCKTAGMETITVKYGQISKTCTININQFKDTYYMGDALRINEESFFVIEDSDATQKNVLVIAKECIDTKQLIQSPSANKIAFSSTAYWSSTATAYPYDLTETDMPNTSHYAAKAAYDYGVKFGGIGRLLTLEEAQNLSDNILYGIISVNGWLDYWIGSASDNTFVEYVDGDSEDITNDMYYNKNCVRPVIEISKSIYDSYTIGQEVSVGAEEFYVIEDSDILQKDVTLLAKQAVNTTQLIQSPSANKIAFSSTNYWSSTATEYPYDLTEKGVPISSHYATKAAYDYGVKLGGTGRLLKDSEAQKLSATIVYGYGSANGELIYWLGTATGSENILATDPIQGKTRANKYNDTSTVRPVVEISKELVSIIEKKNMITFDMYEVSYEAEEGMSWREYINSSYNQGGFYIDEINGQEYVFYDLHGDPIGCRNCTRRQRVEYEGDVNYAGICWNCGENNFEEIPNAQQQLIEFKIHGNTYYTEEGMTWRDWIDSEYNDGYIYIDTFNGSEYIFSDEYGAPIGCIKCTRRQLAEYGGVGNQAGLCWDCQEEYTCFVEYPADGMIADQFGIFWVCGEEFHTDYDMTWSEWVDSEYNIYGIYIGDDGYVYCFDGEALGCANCTRRQLAEYDGYGNIAGICWECHNYRFEEFPF